MYAGETMHCTPCYKQDLKAPHHIVRTLFKLYDHAGRVYAYSLSLSAIIARIDFIDINVY